MSLSITDVRIFKLNNPKSKLLGFATITFNDVLVVEDWKIFNGSKGLFVASPSKKTDDTENPYRDTVKIIETEANQAMQKAVLSYWNGDSVSAQPSVKKQYEEQMGGGDPVVGDAIAWG